jgi:uncharacterized membrane protein
MTTLIDRFTYSTVVKLLFLLTAFCGLLIAYQAAYTQNYTYFFLGWNLFLAWVPLLFALIWQHRLVSAKPLASWKQLGLFGLWLLFWPNAPYLITDLVHLNRWINPAQWIDILLFFAAACTGLLLGLYGLYKVHQILKNSFNSWQCWLIMMSSIVLSSYGIYLGRVQRWNSWDILTKPHLLIQDAFMQLANPEAWSIIVGFSLFLGLSYFITIQLIQDVRRKR